MAPATEDVLSASHIFLCFYLKVFDGVLRIENHWDTVTIKKEAAAKQQPMGYGRQPLFSFNYVVWGLESQKKLLLSSYAHKKCHVILCPHMVSSQQARYPLDEGSVCVVEFITDFFMVCSSRSFPRNLPEFGFANSIQLRAEDILSTPNAVLHTCCSTTSHPGLCRVRVHTVCAQPPHRSTPACTML